MPRCNNSRNNKSQSQSGGLSLGSSIADLAIPFGLMLAQKTVEKMFANKKKKQTGGRNMHENCVLCRAERLGQSQNFNGGGMTDQLRQELANLASGLENILNR